jgi:hypothetical protein
MFTRGSRYRDAPLSTQISAKGEAVVSVELRRIPSVPSSFVHRARSRERLDLLAYKYYADSARWWQIADANPSHPFPLDLLDQRPFVDEELALVRPGYLQALDELRIALALLGPVEAGAQSLMAATLTIEYTAESQRSAMVQAMTARGFGVLASHFWPSPAGTREAFTIESPAAKRGWQALVSELASVPGVWRIVPIGFERLALGYNEASIPRESLLAVIESHGFSVIMADSVRFERVGAPIAIPPNRVT